MNNNEKKYYTYVVKCTEGSFAGKVYFGCHITNNLEDSYIGSGKKLQAYLKKYPNGYTREILNYYSSAEELNKAEYDLIHPHLGKDYCLNLTEGGGLRAFPGELHPMYNKHHTDDAKQKIRDARAKQIAPMKGKHHSEETKRKIREDNLLNPRQYWLGKHLPEEMRNKISEGQIGRIPWNKGKRGSQKSAIKGKHKVWDNKELNKFHYE